MCEIAPFGKKCALEGFDLMACACHKLFHAVTELKQAIPFFGKDVPDYHCPDFEVKKDGEAHER